MLRCKLIAHGDGFLLVFNDDGKAIGERSSCGSCSGKSAQLSFYLLLDFADDLFAVSNQNRNRGNVVFSLNVELWVSMGQKIRLV